MAAFRPEIYLDAFKQYFKEKVSLVEAVRDFTPYVAASARRGDNVKVPSLTLPASVSITPGSATNQSVTDTTATITLSNLIGNTVAIDTKDQRLNHPDYVNALMQEAGYRNKVGVNIQILSMSVDSTVSGSAAANLALSGTTGAITDAIVLAAAAALDAADAPAEDRYLVVNPARFSDLMGITTFTSLDFQGGVLGNSQNVVAKVRGFNVISRPNSEFVDCTTAGTNAKNLFAFHKDALGIAFAEPHIELARDAGQYREILEYASLFGVSVLKAAWCQTIIAKES